MTHRDTDTRIFRTLWHALIAELGGSEVAGWLDLHYADGLTLDAIEARTGVSRSVIHRRMSRMRSTLAAHGLLPAKWQQRNLTFRPAIAGYRR